MQKLFCLTLSEIKANVLAMAGWLKRENADAIYISSFDPFLNEYVPLEDNHRYYFTGFTGSVAEVLLLANGKVHLFVDGRYHQQADLEVDKEFVLVEKCPFGVSNVSALLQKVRELNLKTIFFEGERTVPTLVTDLSMLTSTRNVSEKEFPSSIKLIPPPCLGTIRPLNVELTGETSEEKLARILKDDEAIFLSSLDSIAWLTNCRGYQLPYQSTFRAKCFASRKKIFLFVTEDCLISNEAKNIDLISWVVGPFNKINNSFEQIIDEDSSLKRIKNVFCDFNHITAYDKHILIKAFGNDKVIDRPKGILDFHAIKNPIELQQMERSFQLADQAIARTIKWVKKMVDENHALSELDYYHKANQFYADTNCLSLSFHTIAAVGANSSIIHFASPKAENKLQKNQLVLLDSGAYYQAGLATDTTRTFFSGGTPTTEQKRIYTLVLKALLQVQNAVFPPGTKGSFLDGVCRMAMLRYGYNYAHGTGHGVGINVHEGNYSINPTSQVPLYPGLVGSLEPGIYIPGLGGVRLENICVVEKHPDHAELLRFRSLGFVGFDYDLIEDELLNSDEKIWLQNYEAECARRGTSLKTQIGTIT